MNFNELLIKKKEIKRLKGCNYIYLLIEREFIKTNENIYKLGRTNSEINIRFLQYPKNSKLLFYTQVFDCIITEDIIIKECCKLFIQRKDIGKEYFEGDINEIIKVISDICLKYPKN